MKKIVKIFISSCLGLLILASFAIAEEIEKKEKEEEAKLEEIVVTATKTERKVEDLPVSVEVVTKDEIKNLNVETIQDAVKSLSGVSTKGAKGIAELYPSISLRGMSGDRILILVDGKEVPAYQWPRIPVESIERIEVVKGAASSLYGSNAMGGIVNIITRIPEEGIKAVPTIGYESNNTRIYQLYLSGKKKKIGFTFNLQRRDTDGYVSQITTVTGKEVAASTAPIVTGAKKTYDKYGNPKYEIGNPGDNYYKDENYALKLSLDITETQNLRLGLMYSNYEYGYEDGQTLLRNASGIPYYGTATGETVQIEDAGKIYEFKVKNTDFYSSFGGNPSYSVSLDYNNQITQDLRLKTYLNYIKSKSWYNDPAGKSSEAPENKYQFELQLDKGLDLGIGQVLTFGIFGEKSDKESEKWYLADWRNKDSKIELNQLSTGDVKKFAVFLQDELYLGKYVTLLPGVRYDWWEFSGDSKFRTTQGAPLLYDQYDAKSESQISPKLSILFKPIETLSFRASAGQGFNTPDIGSLVNTWAYGGKLYNANPNLKPEKNTYYEIGAECKLFDKVKIKGAYFNNQVENMIYYKDYSPQEIANYNTQNGTNYTAINIKDNLGKGELVGYETEISVGILEGLSTFANYTYTDSEVKKFKTRPEIVGKEIPYIIKEKASFGIDYILKNFTAALRGNYTGDCFTTDDNSDTKDDVYGGYDSYMTWDATVSYKFKEIKNLLISFTVNNIFDKKYYEYYRSPGRIIGGRVGMEF